MTGGLFHQSEALRGPTYKINRKDKPKLNLIFAHTLVLLLPKSFRTCYQARPAKVAKPTMQCKLNDLFLLLVYCNKERERQKACSLKYKLDLIGHFYFCPPKCEKYLTSLCVPIDLAPRTQMCSISFPNAPLLRIKSVYGPLQIFYLVYLFACRTLMPNVETIIGINLQKQLYVSNLK